MKHLFVKIIGFLSAFTFDPIREPVNYQLQTPPGPITYTFGGKVLTGKINCHVIYYGNFDNRAKQVVQDFISGVSNTPWGKILQNYYYQANQNSPKIPAGTFQLGKIVTDNFSQGKILNGYDVMQSIVSNQIKNGKLPFDSNSIYVILVDGNVQQINGLGNYCQNWCGYHYSFGMNGQDLLYAVTGYPTNPTICPSKCAALNTDTSPNGSPAIDAMISILAHELAETVTNGLSDAWEGTNNLECGDICSYQYGSYTWNPHGFYYNMRFGAAPNTRNYLVQKIWDPITQICQPINGLSFTETCPVYFLKENKK